MRRGFTLFTVFPLLLAVYYPGCDSPVRVTAAVEQAPIDQLWRAPQSIAAQDLFNGPWGQAFAPEPGAAYRFLRSKTRGVNPGMTVVDEAGRRWSVKQAAHDGRGAEG